MTTLGYTAKQAMPASLEVERSVLGHFLMDNGTYDEAIALGLSAADFSCDTHRRIFLAYQFLFESGPVDLALLTSELDRRGDLESVGDIGYVSGLVDIVPDWLNIKRHVRLVLEKSKLRKIVRNCDATMAAIADGCSSGDAISSLHESLLQVQTGSDDAPAQRVVEFTDAVYNEWEKLIDADEDLIGLTTGLECLDLTTTGIRRGELWVIGGRTGDGKTSLALQIAGANCRREIPVGMFSIEMSKGDLLQRLWSLEGPVPFKYLRYPRHLPDEMRANVRSAMAKVGQWPLFIVEDGSLSIQRLIAKARLLIRQEHVQLLIVDYLQIVSAVARDERERLTKVSNALRALAKDTGVPVIAISQLTRPKDGSQNLRPNKFSLKESGTLENDAHVVVMTYRPVNGDGLPTGDDELIIAKQRHGPISNERVYFDSKMLRFLERQRA